MSLVKNALRMCVCVWGGGGGYNHWWITIPLKMYVSSSHFYKAVSRNLSKYWAHCLDDWHSTVAMTNILWCVSLHCIRGWSYLQLKLHITANRRMGDIFCWVFINQIRQWVATCASSAYPAHGAEIYEVEISWYNAIPGTQLSVSHSIIGPVFTYTLRYIVGFRLVEMDISTNPKPTIYRHLYENTGPAGPHSTTADTECARWYLYYECVYTACMTGLQRVVYLPVAHGWRHEFCVWQSPLINCWCFFNVTGSVDYLSVRLPPYRLRDAHQ